MWIVPRKSLTLAKINMSEPKGPEQKNTSELSPAEQIIAETFAKRIYSKNIPPDRFDGVMKATKISYEKLWREKPELLDNEIIAES